MRGFLSIGERGRELKPRGRASTAVLALVAVIAIAAAGAWLVGPDPGQNRGPAEPQRDPRPDAAAPGRASLESPRTGVDAPTTDGRAAEVPRLHPLDPARFAGKGRIRGFVSIEGSLDFPQVWTIAVEPSKTLIGGKHAQSRTIEFEHGQQEFAFDELALGGYSLRAQAFGLDSGERNVLLARPGETDLYLSLTLAPTGFVEGRFVDRDGLAVEGLPLVLRSVQPGQVRPREERATRTRADGSFLIDDVKKGLHHLHVGSADNPILPPIVVRMHRRSTRLEDVVLPPLGQIEGLVVDASGRILTDQPVEGYGDAGGRIQTRTDRYGEFRARFLPGGRYTLFARNETWGVGKVRTQLDPGATAKVEIRLGP